MNPSKVRFARFCKSLRLTLIVQGVCDCDGQSWLLRLQHSRMTKVWSCSSLSRTLRWVATTFKFWRLRIQRTWVWRFPFSAKVVNWIFFCRVKLVTENLHSFCYIREARGRSLKSTSLKTACNTNGCTEEEGTNQEFRHRMQRLFKNEMRGEKERETRDFNQNELVHLSTGTLKLLSVGFWPLNCIQRRCLKIVERTFFELLLPSAAVFKSLWTEPILFSAVNEGCTSIPDNQHSEGMVRRKKTKLKSKQEKTIGNLIWKYWKTENQAPVVLNLQ